MFGNVVGDGGIGWESAVDVARSSLVMQAAKTDDTTGKDDSRTALASSSRRLTRAINDGCIAADPFCGASG
jgi:hypothetical protein